MRQIALPMLALLAGFTAAAGGPEIYRCTQDDGTVAFQQMPCRPAVAPEAAPVADARDAGESETAADTPAPAAANGASLAPTAPGVAPQQDDESNADQRDPVPVSDDRTDCEKSARDAIDAIDAELRASDSPDEDRARLDELLELTRRLRLCKQL